MNALSNAYENVCAFVEDMQAFYRDKFSIPLVVLIGLIVGYLLCWLNNEAVNVLMIYVFLVGVVSLLLPALALVATAADRYNGTPDIKPGSPAGNILAFLAFTGILFTPMSSSYWLAPYLF